MRLDRLRLRSCPRGSEGWRALPLALRIGWPLKKVA
jgi:hypothetical protein